MMCKGYLWTVHICLCGMAIADRGTPPGINPDLYQQHPPPHAHQPIQQNQYIPPHQHSQVNQQGHVPISQQQYHVPSNVEIPHHSGPVPHSPQVPQYQQPVIQQAQVPVQVNMPQQGSVQQPNQMPVSGQAGNVPHHSAPVPQQPHDQFQQGAGHHQHHSQGQQPVLKAKVEDEKEHIGEHFDIPIDTSKMTEQELQFHYFKMHDSDGNNKLDGCELTKSLIHWHEQGRNNPNAGTNVPQPKIFTDEELANLIDPILEMDDLDKDGYIDYAEFMHAQSKGSAKDEL